MGITGTTETSPGKTETHINLLNRSAAEYKRPHACTVLPTELPAKTRSVWAQKLPRFLA